MMPTVQTLDDANPTQQAWMRLNFIDFAARFGHGRGNQIYKKGKNWTERIELVVADVADRQHMGKDEARDRIFNQLLDDAEIQFPDLVHYWEDGTVD